MVEVQSPEIESQEMTDEEAINKIVSNLKDSVPQQDEKNNIWTFLTNVVEIDEIDKVAKVGNLRDDKDIKELGVPQWNVRGALTMARISDKLMNNSFYKEYFERQALETLITSLSLQGFLVRQATTTTKSIADVTKRRKINRGMFGKKNVEESGGDPYLRETE